MLPTVETIRAAARILVASEAVGYSESEHQEGRQPEYIRLPSRQIEHLPDCWPLPAAAEELGMLWVADCLGRATGVWGHSAGLVLHHTLNNQPGRDPDCSDDWTWAVVYLCMGMAGSGVSLADDHQEGLRLAAVALEGCRGTGQEFDPRPGSADDTAINEAAALYYESWPGVAPAAEEDEAAPGVAPAAGLVQLEVPNLDCCDDEELAEYRRVFTALAGYCCGQQVARRNRAEGDIPFAMRHESECERVYQQLPDWARW